MKSRKHDWYSHDFSIGANIKFLVANMYFNVSKYVSPINTSNVAYFNIFYSLLKYLYSSHGSNLIKIMKHLVLMYGLTEAMLLQV